MINQEDIFLNGEGNNWFKRNKEYIELIEFDWISEVIKKIRSNNINSILECGCSSGYRLSKLKNIFPKNRIVGFDISQEAIEYGKKKYPEIELYHHKISESFDKGEFDLIICNFVLHWVDRRELASVIANMDKMTSDNGHIIIGDFLPDYNHKNRYHHLSDEVVYTYKQDYSNIFESLGTYKMIGRYVFTNNIKEEKIDISDNDFRASISVLNKNLFGFYKENL